MRRGGPGAALERKERLNREKWVPGGTGEARLATLACPGRRRGMRSGPCSYPEIDLGTGIVDSIPRETVGRTPPKTIQIVEKETVVYPARTERGLCVCHGGCACAHRREYGDDAVPGCMDETSIQLTKETRIPVPGRPARYACEYRRNGTANLFMAHAPPLGRRHGRVTERRTGQDFAGLPKKLPMSISRKRGSCS